MTEKIWFGNVLKTLVSQWCLLKSFKLSGFIQQNLLNLKPLLLDMYFGDHKTDTLRSFPYLLDENLDYGPTDLVCGLSRQTLSTNFAPRTQNGRMRRLCESCESQTRLNMCVFSVESLILLKLHQNTATTLNDHFWFFRPALSQISAGSLPVLQYFFVHRRRDKGFDPNLLNLDILPHF